MGFDDVYHKNSLLTCLSATIKGTRLSVKANVLLHRGSSASARSTHVMGKGH